MGAQVVVLCKEWSQKDLFREKLIEELKRQPTTPLYYPGSAERRAFMEETYKSKCTTVDAPCVAENQVLKHQDQILLVDCGVPSEEGYDGTALTVEAFGPVLAVMELPNEENGNFLSNVAVPFVNDKHNIYGSLSCVVLNPKAQPSDQLERAIASLRYGAVAVNQPSLLGYSSAMLGGVWGAHPLDKTGQSGNGQIGNQYKLPNAEKTVVLGPTLETSPVFDQAKTTPRIFVDVLDELLLSESTFTAICRAVALVISRSWNALKETISC